MEKNTLELKQGTESKVFQPYREVHFWSFGLLFSHPDVQHAELEKKKSYLSSSALIWKASSSQSNNLCVNSLTSCC